MRILVLLGIGALAPLAFRDFNPLPQDFIAYWAAGRLNLRGDNPYSPAAMLTEQQGAGWTLARPLMVWYPPWVLPLFIPFGALPFKFGWLVWFVLDLGLILFCADWLWRRYNGPLRLRWLAWLSSILTSYTLHALAYTQATPLMLLGLVLFLKATSGQSTPSATGRVAGLLPWGALLGAGLLLVSIKPQLLYLFWILLGVWALAERRFAILAAGGISFLALAALSTIFNPSVWGQYLTVLREYPPDFWATPTLGFLLRQVFGWEQFWIQFPGLLLGLTWAAWRWKNKSQAWEWDRELPLLIFACLMTTPHTWTHDQILLIPAQMAVMAPLARGKWSPAAIILALAWLALHTLSFALHFWISDAWFFWQAPAILALYLVGMRLAKNRVAVP